MEDVLPPEEYVVLWSFHGRCSEEQLSISKGERLMVHAKISPEWWWAELRGVFGYVPASYLYQGANEDEEEDAWQDEEYYFTYGTLNLHLEMLSDKSRTETYRRVIVNNSASLHRKVVMDLGCGTGIMSLFCAQLAQPAAVYAVEASSMVEHTKELVKQNACEEVITVLRGRAEEIQLPEQVDVLVSEWMGNCLLFEFMVESVLLARDRWLREGGTMWPSSAALTLVPCQAHRYYADKMAFWEKPYGLDFTPLQPLALQEFFAKPKFSHLMEPGDRLASPVDVIHLDMYTLQVADLEEMQGEFKFRLEKSGVFHGFAAWFSVCFESLEEGGAPVELNTGPDSEPTHWKQTLFMLDEPVSVRAADLISGRIILRRNPVWRRHLTVTIHWDINGHTQEEPTCQAGTKSFPMWR
ncbi:protein arginine N-methyltransferase 2 isoform X1 [Phyllopteryx taeniolatus]|uniref:protein arginine N-methyltransferase 2 isoform X1 n=1 Tax=Phyllopteryx taeniolatus TaxID=161469 RepID=UPI002AD42972|nr:protein arginine N-methyltransferase 2 isoform X1 [Phyllopteryx taeniolatus]